MDLLLLYLLSPVIFVQGYGKSGDPNDEPFLPIYPVYPYSPKLIKRGAEGEPAARLSPELYAPKVDSKDSYSGSYNVNYLRDPYYPNPNYNPYSKVSPPSNYAYHHATVPYSYPSTAYTAYNSYSSPYIVPPPSYTGISYNSYPNYYYQPPYYYPNYYNQVPPPPPPPPPRPRPRPLASPAADYPSGPSSDSESSNKVKEKSPDGDNDISAFVDGANYISDTSKDLDGRSTSYKATRSQNQLEQSADLPLKNLPIPLPKTTYRVISVAGQPVGPDYPLPESYAKAQQLEELMSRAWSRLVAQDLRQAARYSSQESNPSPSDRSKDDRSRFVTVPRIAKAGPAYVATPSILRKLNAGPTAGHGMQAAATRPKSFKYPVESNEYENYEPPPSRGSQDYDGSTSQVDKLQQNYEEDQEQADPYPSENYATVHPPPEYDYRYTGYDPSQAIAQQQPQQFESNSESKFGTKTKGA